MRAQIFGPMIREFETRKDSKAIFFFPGDRTAGDVYDGSIQAHMDRLYRKKV